MNSSGLEVVSPKRTLRRLIVCQGTAQLVTALAALEQHTRTRALRELALSQEDHLLICGLGVSEPQVDAFSSCIERMAHLLHSFRSVRRMSDAVAERLWTAALEAESPSELTIAFEQATGIATVDEVFVVRDWQLWNVLALNAFPDATHVCYGDSVGVYLPPTFGSRRESLRTRLAHRLRSILSTGKRFPSRRPRLDLSYLLLPEDFGSPPTGEVVRTSPVVLRSLFSRLRPMLRSEGMAYLSSQVQGKPLWVLMGSNFSEQGMMTRPDEIAAYRKWIEAQDPRPGTVLLVKSHPRDNASKQAFVVEAFREVFAEVLSAEAAISPYIPFEVALLELQEAAETMEIITFSTACLATRRVLNISTRIGFGEQLVNRYVAREFRATRNQHETDLRRTCGIESLN